MKAFQSIFLRQIIYAPWFISNHFFHTDLNIKPVNNLDYVKAPYEKFHSRLSFHSNPLISNQYSITIPSNHLRCLKRRWCSDFLYDSDLKLNYSQLGSYHWIVSLLAVIICLQFYFCQFVDCTKKYHIDLNCIYILIKSSN